MKSDTTLMGLGTCVESAQRRGRKRAATRLKAGTDLRERKKVHAYCTLRAPHDLHRGFRVPRPFVCNFSALIARGVVQFRFSGKEDPTLEKRLYNNKRCHLCFRLCRNVSFSRTRTFLEIRLSINPVINGDRRYR